MVSTDSAASAVSETAYELGSVLGTAVLGSILAGAYAAKLALPAGLTAEQAVDAGETLAGAHHVALGGFALSGDGRRLVVVATEDNLLKGAATQALQNLNLAFGLDEVAGIPLEDAA